MSVVSLDVDVDVEVDVPKVTAAPVALVLRTPKGDVLAWWCDGDPPPEVVDDDGTRYLRGRVASGGRGAILPTPWGELRLATHEPLRFAEYFQQPPPI